MVERAMDDYSVVVSESGEGPYAQFITAHGHAMIADEPEALGGRNAGASPYEYLMAGLGACTAMTLRIYATSHQWPLGKITVLLRHEKIGAPDGHGKIDRFEREIRITGELSQDQRTRLLSVAQQCPVSRTLQRSSVVISRIAAADRPVVAAAAE
jgi:putative redox protein